MEKEAISLRLNILKSFSIVILLWNAINFLLLIHFKILALLRDNMDSLKKLVITKYSYGNKFYGNDYGNEFGVSESMHLLIFRPIPYLHKRCAIAHGRVHSLTGGVKKLSPFLMSPHW